MSLDQGIVSATIGTVASNETSLSLIAKSIKDTVGPMTIKGT